MNSPIEIFQQLYALSVRMVEAARSHDWETLSLLEGEVAVLNHELPQHKQMELDSMNLKATLVARILENDAEIRRHTEPWMEDIRPFLGDAQRRLRERQRALTQS